MRTKEFLSVRGIEFESINIQDDQGGLEALLSLGPRTAPVVAKGDAFVFGQSIKDVAAFLRLGIEQASLAPDELVERLDLVLAAAARLVRQIPPERLGTNVRQRKRSFRELGYHVFRIAEAFLEVAGGAALTDESVHSNPPGDIRTTEEIAAFGRSVGARLGAWWAGVTERSLETEVRTYWGLQPLHEVLERTTWHAAQHVRQIAMMLETWGIAPDGPLSNADLEGLPLPEKVWED